jgi:hypothetical protein
MNDEKQKAIFIAGGSSGPAAAAAAFFTKPSDLTRPIP